MAAASDELRLRRAVEIIQDLERRLAEHAASDAEPIAVVGLACRMPGCDSAEELWQLLDEGRDPIAEPPIAGGRPAGRVASLESFDARFFEISAREAVTMDPRQRVILETTWEALEHAGVVPGTLEGTRVGVFVGASGFVSPLATEGNMYEFTGALPGVIAGRVSYALGLRGPCMSIDTACSSSLVALHLACRALRARECTTALAGGVARIEPALLDVEAAGALAPLDRRGRCRTFDAAADGVVLSDGCGMVVLKRLGDAERDGDRILAVVRGSALGHDGRAQGLTVPSLVAQEDVLQRALADARVDPDQIAYVECHGTGTRLGDPIEVQALGNVFGRGRAHPLVLGSIKSNIGHTDAAAGVAGVVKVILALQHGRIPANLHFTTPNPHIPWGELAVTVAAEPVAWPRNGTTRLAGVSSFGISGTNAHLVLQEAPAPFAAAGAVRPVAPRSAQLVVLSGKTAEALDQAAARLRSHLEAHPELALDDVAYSLAVTRTHHEHRLACPVASTAALGQALELAARGAHGELPVGASRGQASAGSKVVFVCSGGGSQWIGMGQQLLDDEPVFRDALVACDRAILRETGWSVLEQLRAPAGRSQLDQVEVVQPALFSMAVALAALWRSWGIEPSAVVGHSQGEIAAGCIAGALTLEAAAAVVCRRSRLARRICGRGEMAMVQLSLAETQAALRGREHALSVAVTSSRRSTVISGAPEAMAEVLAVLGTRGVFCKRIRVDYASHSPQVDVLRDELVEALADVGSGAPAVPMRSTVTGAWIREGELTAAYWADNLRQPVRFAEAVDDLLDEDHAIFVELSPHPVLVPAIEELRSERGAAGAVTGSLQRDHGERASLLAALGKLHVAGQAIRWPEVLGAAHRVALPSYPWQHAQPSAPPPALRTRAARGPEAGGDAEVADWFHAIEWRARRARRTEQLPAGRWGLVGDDAGVASALGDALSRAGAAVVVAPRADGVEALLARGELTHVILVPGDEREALAGLRAIARSASSAPRCWLVTRGAVSTGPDDPPAHSDHAAIWGLGRSFALEHPRAWGGLLDLPGNAPDGVDELADRAAAWLFESSEDQIAVRPGATLVPRLVPRAPRGDAPAWTTAGTALVTGGLGGLGVALAHWLVRRGVRQLLLTSRRGLEAPGARELVEQLTVLGAEVRVARADAADREAMAAAVSGLAAPVTAVFHAAGVTDGTPIAELPDARLTEVLSPKRDGARVLAELARDWALDAFVCFSSCSGVWGHGGQAAYAAANACLDAWAPAARARGIPALAVSWGRWGGAGLGNHERVDAYLTRRGFRAMAPERALSALEQVLASGEAHAVIADIDWAMFRKGFEAWRPSPLLAELERGRDDRRPEPAGRQPAWRDQLLTLSPAQRRAAILDVVRAEVARVLAMAGPQAVAPGRALRELGLDSLMAVELQNALGRRLATALPTTLAFDHPTPDALADHLAARIAEHDPGGDAGAWLVEPGRRERAADAWLGPLSHGQERLWFLDHLAPRSALYNELWGVQLTAELDLALLRRCLAVLVCRHEALRTTFPELAIPPELVEQPRALIAPDGPVDLATVDLRGDDDRRASLTRLATELRDRPFDLARGPLWRVLVATLADDHHVVLFAQHHIITDGTSRRIMADELAELHRSGGDPDVLPASLFDFSDFVRDERRRGGSAEHQRRIAWWRQPLDGLARLELPYARAGRSPGHAGDAVDVSVSPAVRRAIRELAVREGFTVYEILLTAWACVLQRYTGQSDFAIGTISANRGRTELDRMVGFFVNTLVVRCDLPARVTFCDLVRRLGATVRDAIAHDVDFSQVVQAHAGDRGRERNPILQVTLNLLPPPSDLGSGWAWADQELLPRSRTAKFDLALEFFDPTGGSAPRPAGGAVGVPTRHDSRSPVDGGGGLHGRLEYATDSFDRAMIEQIARHFEVLLAAGVADAGAAIEQLPVFTDEERRRVIVAWNDTAVERPDVCIHALIERQAARTPDAVALVDEQQQLSYAEFELRANQLAHHLIAAAAARGLALGPGRIVGLCLERSVELIVAVLAVLKTGAAYLPLDPSYPAERLAFLLGDSRAALLVSDSAQRGRLHDQAAQVVEIDVERDAIRRCATTRPDATATPDDLVYVIYTSGSTGKPKGVEIGHRGLVNLIEHMAGEIAVVPGDEMLAITSLSFDLSVPDVYLPLTRGAACRLVSRSQAGDGFLLRQAVERATIMQATPSTWHMLIEAGWAGSPRLRAVCGGEAYSWQLAVQLAERTRRVWNCYGPTEATVWSTMWAIDPRRGSVSLGRGIANTRLYVLDADLQPVPVGVPGELFIAGTGLARGYLDRPELTRERFVADPFTDPPGQRMYRTGDRVQWSHDGTLAFLDRRDLQVKVRGFRIELGEVETALDGHPAVLRSAVVAKSSGLDARLVGYYVVRDGAAVAPGELHQHLKATLPAQMIPSALVALPALPLTPNGKVDRRALATLEAPRAQGPALQPRDDLERSLVETWKSVLDLPEIDVGRTFFEQGGTSLLLVRVQRRLHADLGLKVSVAELFAYPSVEALADHLRQARPTAPPRRAEPAAVPVPAPGAGADAGTAPPPDPQPELEDLSMAELERTVKDRLLDFLDEMP